MKINRLSKIILILFLVLSGLTIWHQPILVRAGKFLAPTSKESAEVLILEGTQTVKISALKIGVKLLSDGRAKRMVVVLHAPLKEGQMFALPEKYPQFIINELNHLGLKNDIIEVISTPIPGHPVTLSEAQFVVARLSQDRVRSAILVSEGFHGRRSFAVYKQEGGKLGFHVVPYSYFTEHNREAWWRDIQGVSDFCRESLKLAYYLFRGYISIGGAF